MRVRSLIVAAAWVCAPGIVWAQPLTTTRIASGLIRPVFVTAPLGDTSRLFIVEQRGSGGVATQAQIKILNLATNTINPTPFLTVSGVATDTEQGLLGLAFDPGYSTNGRFYINYTSTAEATVIERYTVSANPNIASPTPTPILTLPQPASNHNGGWMGFGPDGFLYIAMGDGGFQGDPNGNGQSLTTLFGKILRLNVSAGGPGYAIPASNPFVGSPPARAEIWAYGLRNPWRPSFDRQTGDLWIADVGESSAEEVNFQSASSPPFTARNYGWRCFEGNAPFSDTVGPGGVSCSTVNNEVFPIHTYSHDVGCSITGGYVYRGCAMPALRGTYFFADYCSNQIYSLRQSGGVATEVTNRTSQLAVPGFNINGIASFGEDGRGELYICDQGGGEVYKIVPRCSVNCDGSTGSPFLTANDFQCFIDAFAGQQCYANCDGSTGTPALTANDFQCFINKFAAGCN